MELDADDFPFSRDIAAEGVSHFGYWTFNNGFGLIDSLGCTLYDHTSGTATSSSDEGEEQRIEAGKALLQKTFMEIKQL